jgi:hypothetical protein
MFGEIFGVLAVIGTIASSIAGLEKAKSVLIDGAPIINTERFNNCKCPPPKAAIKRKTVNNGSTVKQGIF